MTAITRVWKEAKGVIIPKPNEPDYGVTKPYRVIMFINCLGKVVEKVAANAIAEEDIWPAGGTSADHTIIQEGNNYLPVLQITIQPYQFLPTHSQRYSGHLTSGA